MNTTMNELNYQTLRNAIERLPTFAPPREVWDAVDRTLTSEETLENAIEQLPTYAPPAFVWERVEAELNKPAKIRRLRPVWLSAAAAALVVLTLGTYFWLTQDSASVEQVQVVFAEAEQPVNILKIDWDEDESVMKEVVDAFAQKASFVQEPENQSLLSEWEELNEAKAEIKTMLTKYGNDADLVRTIAEIERQRSAIVKQMAMEI